MNALDLQARKELHEAFEDFRNDPELWVGVLTSAGDKDDRTTPIVEEMNR